MELRENYVRTNGIKLHVMEAGPEDAPMILFLHGFPEFWYAWRKQIPYFSDLGYLVVAPDQRGYNLSDKPEGIASYAITELVKDVVGIIDHYKREQVYLVGHDWGSTVAWWTALTHPELVKQLVIMNVPHPKVMTTNLFTNPKQMQKSWYIYYFQLPGAPEKLLTANNYDWALKILTATSKAGTFTTEDLEKYRTAYSQPGAATAMINWYRASIQIPPAPPSSLRISMPTLMLWGADDAALIPEMAEQSITLCEQGRLIMFDDTTHWIQHEKPDQINPLIEAFFKEH